MSRCNRTTVKIVNTIDANQSALLNKHFVPVSLAVEQFNSNDETTYWERRNVPMETPELERPASISVW